jgi:putative tricarboxylic transport membrane protein
MKRIGACLLGLLVATSAAAEEPISFRGKTITVVVGAPAGGGTDSSARLIGALIANHLPGRPAIVIRNIPGAQGITGMNYFVQQVAPDGLTVTMASTTQADPMLYRKPQSQYDPTIFPIVGGVGRGGTVLVIRKEAEARLYSKREAPVIMGALAGVPRSGMQVTAWGIAYLDWNARWVVGYRGTNDLFIALERGEIDMTTTANLFQIQKLLDTGKFKILSQAGTLQKGKHVPRPEFGDAPMFVDLMHGKLKEPLVQQAFDFWSSLTALDKWFALPPKTPEAIVRIHRNAYEAAASEQDFAELGRKISEDLEPMAHEDVSFLINQLGATSPEAIAIIGAMLRKQGVEAE